MAKEIAFKNGRIFNFERLVTLTLNGVILHTVVHHSSTSIYMPNFIQMKKLVVDGRTYTWAVPSSKSRDTKTRMTFKQISNKIRYCALV